MKKIKSTFSLLFILTLISCNQKSKSAMTFTNDPNSNDISCNSTATSKKDLVLDLKDVLEKGHKQQILNKKQIIVYIDATNGVLFFSDYNSLTDKHDDSTRIILYLSELWEKQIDNSNNFNDIVISSLKLANDEIDNSIRKSQELYYQTESSETELLN